MSSKYIDEMVKIFESFRYSHGVYEVFEDFLEVSAIAISNSVDSAQRDEREKRYLQIIKKYSKEEATLLTELFAKLVLALEQEPSDYLGTLFMNLNLSNKWRGQVFTPLSVASIMAAITITDLEDIIKDKGYATVNDPTIGAGVLIIALNNEVLKLGLNPQQVLKIVGQDIDRRAVHMSYIQLSLLGLDAQILLGDSLASKYSEIWHSPGHILQFNRNTDIKNLTDFDQQLELEPSKVS